MKHKQQSKNSLAGLARLARENGLTDVQLAQRLNIRPQTIGQTMLAKFHPTFDRVFLFLEAINDLTGKSYTLSDIDPEKSTKKLQQCQGDAEN
jgi:hypothetical protein